MKTSVLTHRSLAVPVLIVLGTLSAGSAFADNLRDDVFDNLETVDARQLSDLRGRAGDLTTVRSEQNLDATVNGSTIVAGAVASGGVSIGEQHFSGVGLIVANTGNSNAINSTMSINFNLQ